MKFRLAGALALSATLVTLGVTLSSGSSGAASLPALSAATPVAPVPQPSSRIALDLSVFRASTMSWREPPK